MTFSEPVRHGGFLTLCVKSEFLFNVPLGIFPVTRCER